MIELTHRDPFKAVVGKYGFKDEDFVVRKDLDVRVPSEEYPTRGSVTVTLRSNGEMRTYYFGGGKDWLPDFEEDLKVGTFAKA
ncbi:MAG: hypothetical protein HY900_29690 [Deltaproteobacteria bacterium]|nr:hypothetical protein [Deltaproteobacteria bacterium]